MSRAMLFVLGLLASALAAGPGRPDEPAKPLAREESARLAKRYYELMVAGQAAFRAGKYADARMASEEAVELTRRLFPKADFPDGHQMLFSALHSLGIVLTAQGEPAAAVPPLREAVDMAKRVLGDDSPHTATASASLAAAYKQLGRPADAEPLLKFALAVREAQFPGSHPQVASSLNLLADAYHSQGKYVEAEPLLERSLKMFKRLHAGDHADVVLGMNNLGLVYTARGRFADAEPLLTEAVAMAKRLFAGDHMYTAVSLTNRAMLDAARQKFDGVEARLEEALAMQRRLIPGDSSAVATGLKRLATVYKDLGKYAAAERVIQEHLRMLKRIHEGDHPDVAHGMNLLAQAALSQGRLADAEPLLKESLAMSRRLHAGDHMYLAAALTALAHLYLIQGRLAEAEPLATAGLDMCKRLFPGDHPEVSGALNEMASLRRAQGKVTEAEPLQKAVLEMARRIYPGDHPELAAALSQLALQYMFQGKWEDSEGLDKEALAMRKRIFRGDHPAVAENLLGLGRLFMRQGKSADAEPFLTDALTMSKRLYAGAHPLVAAALVNLAALNWDRGECADAELRLTAARDMFRQSFPGDHREIAFVTVLLAELHSAQGRPAAAESAAREALAMSRRLTVAFARQQSEGAALTYAADHFAYRSRYLTAALVSKTSAADVYGEVWASKGAISRVYEQRQLRARAAATNPEAATVLADLAAARRRRADFLLAAETTDPLTRGRRETALAELDATLERLDARLGSLLPAVTQAERLAAATPARLRTRLPAGTAVVDYVRYTHGEFDRSKPGREGVSWDDRYLAFVMTADAIACVNLGSAARIETALERWRAAITTPPYRVPADVAEKVRELVWEPVHKKLPAHPAVVYVCPDGELTRIPWAALPGQKPGTILLEDFAVATVPHGPFLLDALERSEAGGAFPAELLAVGGVAFGDEPRHGGGWWGAVAAAGRARGDIPVDTKKGVTWPDLPGAKAEAREVGRRAAEHKIDARVLTDAAASADAVLGELPRVRYAHIATHGFFADPQFPSALRTDPNDYRLTPWGERVGRAAKSPMVLSGLVFAGANRPATPGRGILTGEALVDRDLSGLRLAVLSACETGLGDVAGGEGVYGLQRAFHVAGAQNVVASLWKVPDAATAALMGEFYRHLWDEKVPPVEALRRAQLAVYKATPKELTDLARGPGLGSTDFDTRAKAVSRLPVNAGGRNPPVVWAAWSLSGPGR